MIVDSVRQSIFSRLRPLRTISAGRLFGALALSFAATTAYAQITVSNGGQASTQHAIPMPPGIAGMVPSLGLEYNDGTSSGPLGFGWTIKGISSITRCPASKAIDGNHAAVMMLPSDKLCLDGQRLIQTNASGVPLATQVDDAKGVHSSQAPREFRTEKDSYARIRAYGSAGGDNDLTQGPLYFLVWTKSGQVYRLGGGSPSPNPVTTHNALVTASIQQDGAPKTRVATWAVSRVTDVTGNYINFVYHLREVSWGSGPVTMVQVGQTVFEPRVSSTAGTEWNLAEVQYTGTSTQLPHNKIVFVYEDRPDVSTPALHDRAEAYFLNHKRVTVRRLTLVRSYINSPNHTAIGPANNAVAVRTLKLAYTQSTSTGRSLLKSITECLGSNETRCLPPTRYEYRTTGLVEFEASAAFASTPLINLAMSDGLTPSRGVITGDFNGDGRTDLLRWAVNPNDNELWFSSGGGRFAKQSNFDLTGASHILNDASACHFSVVADFDGDGLTDILRAVKSGCSLNSNVLFRSKGNGTFEAKPLPAGINLSQSSPQVSTETISCDGIPVLASLPSDPLLSSRQSVAAPAEVDNYGPPVLAETKLPGRKTQATPQPLLGSGPCVFRFSREGGNRFYVLDANGDGVLDIVTTLLVPYSYEATSQPTIPNEQQLCAGWGSPAHTGPCTRVYEGLGNGDFREVTSPLDVKNQTLFSDATGNLQNPNPYWRLPDQTDINGDGLQDILSTVSGRWRSRGNFDFTASADAPSNLLCGTPIDFNGDGRFDCLLPSDSTSNQRLTLSFGASASPPVSQFSLTWGGGVLYRRDSEGRQDVGLVIEDFDGDGRQDILRWGPSLIDNGIHLSRGDGSFTSRRYAGLSAILQAADASRSFVMGDFLGDGTVQILSVGTAVVPNFVGPFPPLNQLLVRKGDIGPPDLLTKVTLPGGLSATVGPRVPLTLPIAEGGSYVSDRVIPAPPAGDTLDIQPPMYVISSVSRETGSGTLSSSFRYVGLKAERGGRGALGFREFHQQDPAPASFSSQLTKVQEHLLKHPYNSLVRSTRTYLGSLGETGAPMLSATVNTYCDTTSTFSPDSATDAQPCSTQAKVTRSYLRRSVDSGNEVRKDTAADTPVIVAALPVITTTNTFNSYGDGTEVVVTTTAQVAGQSVTHTRTTINEVCAPDSTLPGGAPCPNKTSGDHWILGRNIRTTSTSTAINLQASLRASAGTKPLADAIQGSPPAGSPPLINPAALAAILQLLLED
jgi:FG-GAP-like repeat/Salmonella virulence plasmid 65kDa B protein